MRSWSFSLGRLFGVDVRLHLLFPLALGLCVLWAAMLGRPPARGVVLYLLLLLAVAVRETARALAAAWLGLSVESVLLLPTGGLLETQHDGADVYGPNARRLLGLAGPIASFLFALLLAGLALAVSPEADLMGQRWVTPSHLVRSAVWLNLLMGAINLLPAWPLDGSQAAEEKNGTEDGEGAELNVQGLLPNGSVALGRRLIGLSFAVALVVFGIIAMNWWILAGGMTVLLFAQAQRQGLFPVRAMQGLTVGDVMLTDFAVLSASATLEDALLQARHSQQEIYPVVRGTAVVGAIGRQAALNALEARGNSYVQGAMVRQFETVAAAEPLSKAWARVTSSADSQVSSMVPVLEGDRIVGLLTPEHLNRAMTLVNRERARKAASQLNLER